MFRSAARPLAYVVFGLSTMMLLSAVVGLVMGSADGAGRMGISAALVGIFAFGLLLAGRDRVRLDKRGALLVVSLSWLLTSLLGAIPFVVGAGLEPSEAIFESTSGFTTTGATVLPEIRARLDPALHFWRMLTHWLGGMGIVVLFVAIFPALGVGGRHLYRSEAPGPRTRDSAPRIRQAAGVLWRIYLGLTVAQVLLLCLTGLPPFEAVVHALSTMGTGGFSTFNGSIGELENVAAELVIMVFMVVAGMNFALWPEALKRGPKVFLQHTETRVYLVLIATVTVLIAMVLMPSKVSVVEALRHSGFQVAAVVSTTGFGTDDFDLWPTFAKLLLLVLYFTGGCAGSTAGGMKLIRVIVVVKAAWLALKRSIRPHLVQPVRVDRQVFGDQAVSEILAFMTLWVLTAGAGAIAVALLDDVDGTTAIMASIACVANVGPGFGLVGPTDNFGFFSPGAQYVLCACMLLGRLEFLTLLALLTPSFWRS
jgi:trk system potassium uptake protein TrkH